MDINKICPGCMKEVGDRDSAGTCPHCGYDLNHMEAVSHQMQPFTILAGKYLVGRVIGEGGFGITYLGLDLNLEIVVAIKEFYPNGFVTRESKTTTKVTMYAGSNEADVSRWRNSFLNEARNLAKFSNLNGIVEVRDFFNENNTAYIVMEYIDGITLKQYLKQNGGKIPVDKVFEMMEPVIRSMSKVHDVGMIHRDISPDNIMITKYGGMKLLDFGAAREFAGNAEKSLSIMLKPGYAPEEQYRSHGKQGPWSDVYALTATIYKCITGVTPVEAMERMREDTLKMPKELGVNITDIQNEAIKMGMSVYAENRLQNMDALYKALYTSGTASAPPPPVSASPEATPLSEPCVKSQAADNQANGTKDGFLSQRNVIIMLVAACGILLVVLCCTLLFQVGKDASYVKYEDRADGFVEKVEKSGDTKNTENTENIENIENIGNAENTDNAGSDINSEVQEIQPAIDKIMENPETQTYAVEEDKTSIHRYELVIGDYTWTQAYIDSISRGGYLVHINSEEEYDVITSQIIAEEKTRYSFWIGANRKKDSYEYHWKNADGTYDTDPFPDDYWLPGEPTFYGNADNDIRHDEDSVNMFYRKAQDRFYWNDAPDDIIGAAGMYKGKLGYICEYED